MKLEKILSKYWSISKIVAVVLTICNYSIWTEPFSFIKAIAILVIGSVTTFIAINVLDMIKVNRHVLGLTKLSGAYLEAGDANRAGDGVNVLDMIYINRHSLGLATIRQ